MNEQIMLSTILHTRMESYVLPTPVVEYVLRTSPTLPIVVEQKKNEFVRNNLKEWNRMSRAAQSRFIEEIEKECAVTSYLIQKLLIKPGYVNLSLEWLHDEATNQSIGCEVRVFYKEMGVEQDRSNEREGIKTRQV